MGVTNISMKIRPSLKFSLFLSLLLLSTADWKMSARDFRSDTVTKPSPAMREAMATFDVGDDVLGDDPTVVVLEKRVAALFEREASLFFPTGTMANLAAVMVWCDKRGSEMIVGDNSHIFLFEQGGSASIGGVASRPIRTEPDGTLPIESILASVRVDNVHFPVTQLVCLEQTHNMFGGRVLPDGYISQVAKEVKALDSNIKLHVDGARVWNAAISLGKSVAHVTAGADSVQVCLSKGLGAPAGSLLIGPSDFIARARRVRKALGGGMRQVGILAAAGLIALNDFEAGEMLLCDHKRIRCVAEQANAMKGFSVEIDTVDTNICVIHLTLECMKENSFFTVGFVEEQLAALDVKIMARDNTSLRIVTHRDITDSCVSVLLKGLQQVSDSLK